MRLALTALALVLSDPAAAAPADDFRQLQNEYWAWSLRQNPVQATVLGRAAADSLGEVSLASEDRREGDRRAFLRRLDAVADAGNEWIFPELVAEGAAPWRGVRWVAVAASPSSSHAVDISESFEQAVRSLAAHRAYLSALSDETPEQYARRFLDTATRQFADRFGGKRCVPFELFEL